MGPYPLSFLVSILVIVLVPIRRVLRARTARLSLMRKYDCKAPKKYPQKDPLLGLDLVYATAQSAREGRFQESLQHRHETHGRTFQTTILGATVIYTIDPRVVSTVFSSAADRFGAAPIRLPPAECLVGKGIFTTDGTEWACSRELIKPCFARARVTDLTFLEVHVDRLLELIPRDGSTVDLQALFRLLVGRYDTIWHLIDNLIEVQSLDSSTDFLFGKSLDSLQSSESVRVKDFLDSFEIAQYGVDQRVRLGRLRFLCQGKRFSEACAAVHDFIDEYIARALDDMSAGQAKTSKPNNQHKEKYALVKEVGTVVKDKNDLRNQMMNFFIAGHESTAMALSSIFFNLSRSPIAWQKIRSEVIAVGNEPLTFETLKTMQYLRHVISESLRLKPIAPLMPRMCLLDTVLPAGGGPDGLAPLLVTKGQTILLSTYALHRDGSFWGDDANCFRPERWEAIHPGWEYLPFGGGPRVCPARQLALTEVSYVVVRLVQRFKTLENRDPGPWVEALKMSLASKNGVQVGLIPA